MSPEDSTGALILNGDFSNPNEDTCMTWNPVVGQLIIARDKGMLYLFYKEMDEMAR